MVIFVNLNPNYDYDIQNEAAHYAFHRSIPQNPPSWVFSFYSAIFCRFPSINPSVPRKFMLYAPFSVKVLVDSVGCE